MNQQQQNNLNNINRLVPVVVEEDEEEDSVVSNCCCASPELQMSAEEEGWVWNLIKWMEGEDPDCVAKHKQAAGKIPSDYEYAINAIVAKGDKQKADQKIRAVQQFRQKYNIQDTVEEGVQAFRDYVRLQPGHLLHVDTMGPQGSLVAFDFGKHFPSRFRSRSSSQNTRIAMVFCYYLFRICAPNLDVLRGGVRLLEETTGTSHRNMNVGAEQQVLSELFVCAPIAWKGFRFYNTGPLVTAFADLIKHFLPDEMRDAMSVGCQLELEAGNYNEMNDPTNGGSSSSSSALHRIFLNAVRPSNNPPTLLTLPQVFLQPNYDVAMGNLMIKARTLLEERYRNEETFELFSGVAPQHL